jgi:hypothetical protein
MGYDLGKSFDAAIGSAHYDNVTVSHGFSFQGKP